MSKENKFVFPDTSIFLHFQFFTDIAWNEILQAKSVTLIIPPIVAKELDKHKYNHPSERVRDRATKVTKKLAQILRSNTQILPKVNLQFERVEPQNEFKKYHLSKDAQDDHLLASIFLFQEKTGNKIILVTDDMSLIVKAHQLNIEVFELPEEYRVKVEDNPYKKRIAKLEKELVELKVKLPDLRLVFKDDEEKIIAQTLAVENSFNEDVEYEIKKIKEEHPQITETFEPKRTVTRTINGKPYPSDKVEFKLPSGEIKQASLSSIEKYNNELEKFYKEYEKYLNEKIRISKRRARTIKLQIKLKNEGTSPAERVHVILTFPEEFIITTEEDVFSYPKELNPPKFITIHDIFSDSFSTKQFMPSYNSLPDLRFPKVKMFWEEVNIKNKDSIYTASFQNPKLSHGYSLNCPENIYVIFPHNQTVKPFQIKYKISADNLPKAIDGKLNILVNEQK